MGGSEIPLLLSCVPNTARVTRSSPSQRPSQFSSILVGNKIAASFNNVSKSQTISAKPRHQIPLRSSTSYPTLAQRHVRTGTHS
jgi:hypothetical protein